MVDERIGVICIFQQRTRGKTRFTNMGDETSSGTYRSTQDEDSWVIHIRQLWDDDLEQVMACVFKLPSAITSDKHQAYAPQFVSIGPYHYTDGNVRPMERHKVAAAKAVHRGFKGRIEFDRLLNQIRKLKPHISLLYNECLNLEASTLAYIMVIDSLFVFKLLVEFSSREFINLPELIQLTDPLVEHTLKKDGFLRDMLMVENQIPTFVLYNILSFESDNDEVCDQAFPRILLAFCEAISPFEIMKIEDKNALGYAHVLDLLYHLIVHKELPFKGIKNIRKAPPEIHMRMNFGLAKSLWDAAKDLNVGFIQELRNPVDLVEKLSSLPFHRLKSIAISGPNKGLSAEDSITQGAADLSSAGVQFLGAGNITEIKFENETHKFRLPKVKLDANSDTVFRNLLAYEAVAKPGISTFAWYVELMKGLVASTDDVRYLKEKNIIASETLTDAEVAEIFKGMPKSVKSTSANTSCICRAMKEVNDCYNSRCKVKARKCFNKCAFVSQKVFIFCATILLLALMALQAFCSVYNCSNLFIKAGPSYMFI